jgi:hypothetical protein
MTHQWPPKDEGCVDVSGMLWVGDSMDPNRGLVASVRDKANCVDIYTHFDHEQDHIITLTMAEAKALALWLCERIKVEPVPIRPDPVDEMGNWLGYDQG